MRITGVDLMKSKYLSVFLAFVFLVSMVSIASAAKPTVTFTGTPVSGEAPLKVTFTAKSTGGMPTSWCIYFGDGGTKLCKSIKSNQVVGYFTYTKPGKYTVTVTAKNADGSAQATKKSYITVTASKKPVASFGVSSASCYSPCFIKFTDLSTGKPTKWLWNFGDGKTSTLKNPTHTYTWKSGSPTFTTKLTVWNKYGSDTAVGYDKIIK
jgi:PKD repeat protein